MNDTGCLFRVRCGNPGGEVYVDRLGQRWLPDQEAGPGRPWGAIGGTAVAREQELPIADADRPELYRSERSGMQAYEFALRDARHRVRLHFAETFDANHLPGARRIEVRINGLRALSSFDPATAAGGFAKPAVVEVPEVGAPDGKLTIAFSPGAMINAIEIHRTGELPPPRRALKRILFVGNSHCFFWAVPETVELLVNTVQQRFALESDRHLFGGKQLDWILDHTDARARIEQGRYDLVVVQSMRTAGADSAESADAERRLRDALARYRDLARAAGGELMLYCTWPAVDEPLAAYDSITRPNLAAARELGIGFVPAGPAWKRAAITRPALKLHNANDTIHSGMHGAYLAACVFSGVLTGEPPGPELPAAVLGGQVAIAPDKAAFLQACAREALTEFDAYAAR